MTRPAETDPAALPAPDRPSAEANLEQNNNTSAPADAPDAVTPETATFAPMPLGPRRTRFVRAYVTEPNATRAAILAGYSPRSAHNQSSRLMKNDEVVKEIVRLRNELGLIYDLSRETLLDKLEAVYDFAVEHRRFTPAVRAVMAQAKIMGLIISPTPKEDSASFRIHQMTGYYPQSWEGDIPPEDGTENGSAAPAVKPWRRRRRRARPRRAGRKG
jgi:hypothetical protein